MVDDVGMPILVGLGKEPLAPGAAYPSCGPEAACDVLVVDKPDLLSEDAELRSVLSNAHRRGIPVMCGPCFPKVSAALGVGTSRPVPSSVIYSTFGLGRPCQEIDVGATGVLLLLVGRGNLGFKVHRDVATVGCRDSKLGSASPMPCQPCS